MTEETALEILLELTEVNENMEFVLEYLNTLNFSSGLLIMLLSFFFGGFIVFTLTRAIGKGS